MKRSKFSEEQIIGVLKEQEAPLLAPMKARRRKRRTCGLYKNRKMSSGRGPWHLKKKRPIILKLF